MNRSGEILASTVALGRDTPSGLEVLLLKRSSAASFAPDAWVFPGGQIDREDADLDVLDSLSTACRAAARETEEESGLTIDFSRLVAMSRWSPDEEIPKRFLTWILFGLAPENVEVVVDGVEIVDYRWLSPTGALEAHRRQEVTLLPPTWMTLRFLSRQPDCDTAISEIARRPVEYFRSRYAENDQVRAVLWPGDAGFATRTVGVAGDRHRLVLDPAGWRYERTAV